MNKIIPSKLLAKSRSKVLISPLGLLVLAACSGGSGTSNQTFTREGNLVKGPLKDALAFLDYDGSKTQTGDEPFVRSSEDGSYSLTGSGGNESANIVAITDASTVDTSSGAVLSGVTLSAPATASIVSMASTLMVESNLTEAQVQAALGISGDVDLLTFNPFSVGATSTDAEKELAKNIEVSSQQVGAVLTALTASASASGMTAADAFTESLKAVSELVKTKTATSEAVDLTDTVQLKAVADTVKTAVQVKSVTDASIDAVAFANMQETIVSAVSNVNSTIATSVTKDNFSGADAAKIYSVSQVLVDQVSSAVTAEKANKGSGQDSITFDDQLQVTNAAANAAPTDIDLSVDGSALSEGEALSVSEGVGSLDVANVIVTDDTSTAFTFKLAGDDANSFSISTAGVLSFKSQPDFETKDSYSFVIQATDEGGKSFVESFTVKVTDIDEAFLAARGQIITDQSEDATFSDYVNGPAGTFKAPAPVDFTFTDGVVSFGKIEMDLVNINQGLANAESFEDPTLDV
ncbi:MAG: cadherin repeat domain-containing protein, partial [Flavobacteriaceae bacterium]